MEAEERERLLEQSKLLRQELKAWERDFFVANGGRKAGREDIKQDPAIAQKYKDYNRTRDIISGKVTSRTHSSPQKTISQKRKQETTQAQTPSKRLQVIRTPSKGNLHPAAVDPYDSPSLIRNLFTPSHQRVFGPTPQKDGQVLGLFDLMSNEDVDSPSQAHITITGPNGEVQATPRKTRDGGEECPDTMRHSRTPASSGKRFMLDSFATPLKKRHPNEQTSKTPTSTSKLQFTTPSFLRRDSHRTRMPTIEETADYLSISPEMVRLPRKPLVRGLSSMLASLRKMEEEAADEDLEALREMEMEGYTSKASKPVLKSTNEEVVHVEDSQLPGLLGGFDDEGKYDSEPEDMKNPPVGRDGQPLKIFKKKGQKRTTRRVVMKPVRNTKPQREPCPQAQATSSSPEPGENRQSVPPEIEDEEAVFQTQQDSNGFYVTEGGNFDSDSGSEYTASEGGTRHRRPDQQKKAKSRDNGGETAEGMAKKAVRKVGAMAHANFKRLKLRNSGAKGTMHGHGSRFRRRK